MRGEKMTKTDKEIRGWEEIIIETEDGELLIDITHDNYIAKDGYNIRLVPCEDEKTTIDVAEVVRCKGCRWWEDMYGNGVKGYCHACKHGYHSPTWEIGIRRTTDPDFYCGDGERREP